METKIILTYVVCDDIVKNLKIKEDSQTKMNIAEVMTTAIISAMLYSGNLEKARKQLQINGYIKDMLSKSQLNRRLHRIPSFLWNNVLKHLSNEFEKNNINKEFIVDSFPLNTCKLARKNMTKLYKDKKYLGYCAAKKEYFIGFKGHMITDVNGNPVNFMLKPGSESDIKAFKSIDLDLPKNSTIYADKAYNDYEYEDYLVQKNLYLMPIRKKNSKRKSSLFLEKIRKKKRKIIESAFSCIEKLLPRSIHSVTIAGFKLKTMLFVLAYAFCRFSF